MRSVNLKNKDRLLSFFVLLVFAASVGTGVVKAADTPEASAKIFYEWYLGEINAERMPSLQKAMFDKHVSKRLSRWRYSKAYEEYGADYFIDAQDLDEKWRVTTGKAVIKGNTAAVKVKLAVPNARKNDWTNNLTVKMILENGAWKIDSVNNRRLTVN